MQWLFERTIEIAAWVAMIVAWICGRAGRRVAGAVVWHAGNRSGPTVGQSRTAVR